ncbi:MAG: sulfatase-like hydrolase/transferase [Flavobacterium sp.]|nr:sulfatase-like hydrolase/transferase [Flavobacterium sp.]
MKKNSIILMLLIMNITFSQQRNVILIIADDLGKDYCDIYPDHAPITVNLTNVKRLLPRGIVFNNAWSNPLCSPTRAGILTGKYSFRTGVGDVIDGANPKLNINENIIPKVLNLYMPNGISKACIGKWHVTTLAASGYNNPTIMGFDHYEGNLAGALGQPGQLAIGFNNWTKITNGVSANCTNYATTENVNNAISYLVNQNAINANKPFYLQLAFNAPHTPYHLPPANLIAASTLSGTQSDITANPRPYFQAMVEAMDTEIGRFFDYLQTSGKWDNTDIIFIGDNGDDSLVAQSSPSKGSLYQGGVTVPFIISGPDVVNPNRASNATVNTADLFATILELFGNTAWQSQIPTTIVDSHSLLPILNNTSVSARPWAFTEVFRTTPLITDGKAIRNESYKLIKFASGTEKFFNLMLNPTETINLLTGTMTTIDISNYNYLCSEMAALVGTGINCTTLAIENFLSNSNEIYVLENPFQVNIVLNNCSSDDFFELYSVNGCKIFSGNSINNEDFSYLSNGIYFVKMINQNKVFKVIKN